MVSFNDMAMDGAEISLLHAKNKLSTGSTLTSSEKLATMTATFSKVRERYGPTPADAEPVEIPLPETVKGAIANARS